MYAYPRGSPGVQLSRGVYNGADPDIVYYENAMFWMELFVKFAS